jgi:hypothetical protein
MEKIYKNVLIITSSGGSGLLQSAKGQEQEVHLHYPHARVIKKDLMLEWSWKIIGHFGIFTWNWAQKSGEVWVQEAFARWQQIAEVLFWPKVFSKMLYTLVHEDIDWVIDTQVMCTGPLMKAIRLYNHFYKKNVCVQKVTVDLPTIKSTHCFRGIKKLSDKDRKLIKLLTIDPLLEQGQSEKEFWLKNCGLSLEDVLYEHFPIRHSFKKYIGKKREQEKSFITIRTKDIAESALIASIFHKGQVNVKRVDDGFCFEIDPNDKLFVILLGSQPSFEGTFNYVKNFVTLLQKSPPENKIHLFVFCGEFRKEKETLFHAISDHVKNLKNYPSHLSIIPISFQDEDTIASLFYRSNISITRAGGQTAMELMGISSGHIWIHSEVKHKKGEIKSFEELLSGIPAWEAGNTCYLKEKIGSEVVTPETLEHLCRPLFSQNN